VHLLPLTLRAALPSLAFAATAFGLDRLHKAIQLNGYGWTGGEFAPITPFFDYVLVWNTGISLGLLSSLPVWALGIVITLAMAGLVVWWWRTDAPLIRAGLAFALGGAVSNAVDRALYGAVADFFHFHWGEWSFYVFNVADMAISLGVLLLILDAFGIGRARRG
jgi:signal peptidase II